MNDAGDGEDGDKSKPFDPVFNYCLSRPKFLLYKPDRRSEIIRWYDMVEGTSSESETGSENVEPLVRPDEEVPKNAGEFADHDDDRKAEETAAHRVHEALQTECSQPESGSPKLKNETSETKSETLGTEEDDESEVQSEKIEEDEFEEHEVEKGWSLKRLLKLWFVIVVVGLSTLYVSSMNSPSVGLEDEHWMAHSGLHGAPFTHENASRSVIQVEMAKMGFEEASHTIMDEIIDGDHDEGTADGDHEVKYVESQVWRS